MDEEIDLRPYLEAIVTKWYWILGAALLAALTALVVSTFLPPAYEATALVSVFEPSEVVQFDPRFQSTVEERPVQVYPELAVSDELLTELIQALNIADLQTVGQMRQVLSAEPGNDPSLLRMTAEYGDAQETAAIANTWATLFVGWVNEVYGDQNSDQVQFFEEQLAEAAADLDAAEQALIDFQSRSRLTIVTNQLEVLAETQATYATKKQSLLLLLQNATGLQAQIEGSGGSNASLADQLTALSLQLEAFGTQEEQPFQLQVNSGDGFTAGDRQAQLAALASLINTLQSMDEGIDAQLAALEPQILALQQEAEALTAEQTRLTRNRDLADEAYTSLARKVQEERITSQDVSRGVRLASRAAVPVSPSSPQVLLNVVAGTIFGLLVGAFAVVGYTWWAQRRTP